MSAVLRLPTADSIFGREDLSRDAFLRFFEAVLSEEMAEAHRRTRERLSRGEVDPHVIADAIDADRRAS